MKKTIALFLSLLLLLGLTVLVGARTASAAMAAPRSDESAEDAVRDAFAKLCEAESLRYDIGITMEMAMKISAQGVTMEMPINMRMTCGLDMQMDPYLVKGDVTMDVDMGTYGIQTQHILVYGANDGEKLVAYSSMDDGATWTTQENGSLHALLPGEAFNLIQDHVHDVVRAGTETFQGAKVDVYTGLLEGKYINQVVSATGMDGMLSEVTGGDETALDAAELGDIPVTIYIDGDGYPVYYAMDMAEAMNGMLAAAMQELMGMSEMEGMEITIDIPVVRGESTLASFNAVEPIVIPEAALSAPEA